MSPGSYENFDLLFIPSGDHNCSTLFMRYLNGKAGNKEGLGGFRNFPRCKRRCLAGC
jgi:hypothetical protein